MLALKTLAVILCKAVGTWGQGGGGFGPSQILARIEVKLSPSKGLDIYTHSVEMAYVIVQLFLRFFQKVTPQIFRTSDGTALLSPQKAARLLNCCYTNKMLVAPWAQFLKLPTQLSQSMKYEHFHAAYLLLLQNKVVLCIFKFPPDPCQAIY